MSGIRFDYLSTLVALMERLPDERVDMLAWERRPATHEFNAQSMDCGFAGCGIGWAIHAKIVPGLVWGSHTTTGPNLPFFYNPVDANDMAYGWEALEKAFCMNYEQVTHLFLAETYVPISDPRYTGYDDEFRAAEYEHASRPKVIERIRKFIESGGNIDE